MEKGDDGGKNIFIDIFTEEVGLHTSKDLNKHARPSENRIPDCKNTSFCSLEVFDRSINPSRNEEDVSSTPFFFPSRLLYLSTCLNRSQNTYKASKNTESREFSRS